MNIRAILNSNRQFGGKLILVAGDFRQILPVVVLDGRVEIIDACLKSSYLWSEFRFFFLTQNLRANANDQNHANFLTFLNRIGDGLFTVNDRPIEHEVRIPREMLSGAGNFNEFVDDVFPRFRENQNMMDYGSTAILASTNNDVDEINQFFLNCFRPLDANISRTYLSADSLSQDEPEENLLNLTPEFMNSINVAGLPPHVNTQIRLHCYFD